MSEYKRLTEKTRDCFQYDLKDFKHKIGEFGDYDAFFAYSMAVKRLGEIEDKIENGTLYDFPFRIGQEVYIVCDWDIGEAVKGIITEIELTTNKNGTFHRIYVEHKYILSKTNPNVVQYRYIFTKKELFLTKAEAEAKLKELQEKEE